MLSKAEKNIPMHCIQLQNIKYFVVKRVKNIKKSVLMTSYVFKLYIGCCVIARCYSNYMKSFFF